MMDNPGSSALMSEAESQAGGTSFATSSEEVATVPSRWPQKAEASGVVSRWRLSQVELRLGAWHTEPRSNRQTCIDDIDFDTDAQLGDDPHRGQ